MSNNDWDKRLALLEKVIFSKRNALGFFIVMFLYYNKGYTFSAVKIVTLNAFMQNNNTDIHTVILSQSVASMMMAILATILILKVMGFVFSFDSTLTQENQRLKKWARREIAHLNDKARLVMTLKLEQEARQELVIALQKMQGIVLGYEHILALYKPDISRPTKLTEQADKFIDLFDDFDAAKTSEKPRKAPQRKPNKPKF